LKSQCRELSVVAPTVFRNFGRHDNQRRRQPMILQ